MPTFSCPQCPKEFTSQGSLARHRQNHAESAKHVCHVCSVIFRRRDLLTRHLKLHGPDAQPGAKDGADVRSGSQPGPGPAPSAGSGDDASAHSTSTLIVSRRRCHTACNRCRDLKIKCDGHFPCAKCLVSQAPCEFQQRTGRRSQMPAPADADAFEHEGASPRPRDAGPVNDHADAAAASPAPSFSPSPGEHVSADDDDLDHLIHSIAESHASVEPTVSGQGDAHASGAVFPWDSSVPHLDLNFWPSLHEGLFLSDGSLGIVDALGSAGQCFVGNPFGSPGPAAAAPCGPDQIGGIHIHPEPVAQTDWTSMPGTAAPGRGSGHPGPPAGDAVDGAALKQRAVDGLIALASQAHEASVETASPCLWSAATPDLVAAFNFAADISTSAALGGTSASLEHFVKLYADHFHPLWPMLPRDKLVTGTLHPLLYLVLTSIGAMYLGSTGSDYGAMMHNAIRRRLVLPVELDTTQDSLVWLGQARLLTQVAALYFGQPRAFSYAQHLGALLASQARRMCLFSAGVHMQRAGQFKRMKGVATDAERLRLWLDIEERRRLAFGIFRGGIFTSVLLNTKPLIGLDEVDLEFPSCEPVWNGQDMEPRVALEMIELDCTPSRDIRASDLYYILLERDEILPALEPVAHEMLLFGLQLPIWRFSYDRQRSDGLTAEHGLEPDGDAGPSHAGEVDALISGPPAQKRQRRDTFASEAESLDTRSYQMADLADDRKRLMAALARWERALPQAKSFSRTEQDRSYLLSGLILYHMSFMRLYAPVDDIHEIHYRVADERLIPTDLINTTKAWAKSPKAHLALDRVRSMWTLITQQFQLGKARSKFNFNAFMGLHHGAAILWAYNGAQSLEPSQGSDKGPWECHDSSPTLPLQRGNNDITEVFKSLLELFHKVSPAGWSSFADVTVSDAPFPVTDIIAA